MIAKCADVHVGKTYVPPSRPILGCAGRSKRTQKGRMERFWSVGPRAQRQQLLQTSFRTLTAFKQPAGTIEQMASLDMKDSQIVSAYNEIRSGGSTNWMILAIAPSLPSRPDAQKSSEDIMTLLGKGSGGLAEFRNKISGDVSYGYVREEGKFIYVQYISEQRRKASSSFSSVAPDHFGKEGEWDWDGRSDSSKGKTIKDFDVKMTVSGPSELSDVNVHSRLGLPISLKDIASHSASSLSSIMSDATSPSVLDPSDIAANEERAKRAAEDQAFRMKLKDLQEGRVNRAAERKAKEEKEAKAFKEEEMKQKEEFKAQFAKLYAGKVREPVVLGEWINHLSPMHYWKRRWAVMQVDRLSIGRTGGGALFLSMSGADINYTMDNPCIMWLPTTISYPFAILKGSSMRLYKDNMAAKPLATIDLRGASVRSARDELYLPESFAVRIPSAAKGVSAEEHVFLADTRQRYIQAMAAVEKPIAPILDQQQDLEIDSSHKNERSKRPRRVAISASALAGGMRLAWDERWREVKGGWRGICTEMHTNFRRPRSRVPRSGDSSDRLLDAVFEARWNFEATVPLFRPTRCHILQPKSSFLFKIIGHMQSLNSLPPTHSRWAQCEVRVPRTIEFNFLHQAGLRDRPLFRISKVDPQVLARLLESQGPDRNESASELREFVEKVKKAAARYIGDESIEEED
ncbi:hypothetical protein BDK51DRAFT_29999 [Blyttiomyces helicus]|uniref:Uncharacterized protein n=1 Tax=Blyttiomyces helicus TaxID=388810 RepID=A0A4P9WFX7_9FUNG|nr:hypothetical protein BDK51DRAFT_29999 [Blyttiomyces helicus]|eukprot:RKO89346.1 hypothetical protein BDK51DRAFT_29999 [Blyttiomyces helicus]